MKTGIKWLIGLVLVAAVVIGGLLTYKAHKLAELKGPLPDDLAEAEAFALGYQAYVTGMVYARSQRLMEKDIHPKAPLNAPLNRFNVYPGLASPGSAIDFTPNNDTVYGLAWLDLRQGPVLMTLPSVPDRYFTIQATDWALNTFSYLGSRLHSTPGTYAYVPPGWQGRLPDHVTRIEASTTGVFLQARTVVKPEVPDDIAPVVAQLKTYRLQPLDSAAVYPAADPATPVPNPKITDPIWKSLEFFTLLNRAWEFGGVREQDKEIALQALALGIGPGARFDPEHLTAPQRRGLERAVTLGYQRVWYGDREQMAFPNGWRVGKPIGRYGRNRLLASNISLFGYGGNAPEEAIYLPAFIDGENEPLTSRKRYRLHFSADKLPPAEAFWSVSVYSLPDNQLKENPLNRYAIGDRTPNLLRDPDGGLTFHLQRDRPEGAAAVNWLPTGEGSFWLILRMYVPKPEALSGDYVPPPVEPLSG